ncbi:YdbH domain-containing protein [Sneathiella sp.]|uniref:intermembrane phospholipid transport protein YdbH family protein n=1 Tax=Sneathiella sp. TaxID=1964365 RepID=UPI002626E636|nr:YdbH domain-containing protein [Sneathiella sp.]MDF2366651.1 YdbH domain-containing protein [Sneathiella sp.]
MAAGAKSGNLRKLIWGGFFLLVALLVSLILLRSTVLEYVGELALDYYGFDDVTLTVEVVTLDHVTIEELSLSDQIILRDVAVHYTPLSLLRGEIDKAEIDELLIDFSNPEDGAIRQIVSLVNEEGGGEDAVQTRQIPEISLKAGKAFSKNEKRSFHADFSGALSADQRLMVKAMVKAQVKTTSGPIILEDMTLSLRADLGMQSAALVLNGGIIRHAGPKPDWAPLMLTGQGELAAGVSTLQMAVKTTDGPSLMELTGNYDIASASGKVQLTLEALIFRRDGLQPVDLTRYAERFPAIDATVKFVATADIAGSAITYEGDFVVEEMAMAVADGHLVSDRLPVGFRGKYDLQDNAQNARVTLHKSEVSGEFSGKTLVVSDLFGELDVQNLTKKLDLKTLSGVMRDTGSIPDFFPFYFTLAGGMLSLQDLSLQGEVGNRAENFKVDVSAAYGIESGEGKLSFQIPNTQIGKDGASLAGLSSHLKEVGNSLTGTVAGAGEITRDAAGKLVFSSLEAELRDGRWQDKTLVAEGLNFKVIGGQKEEGALFEGDITGRAGNVRLDAQNMAISDIRAGFETSLENLSPGESGGFVISHLKVNPKEGALFKEAQTVTGDASLRGGQIVFSLALASDFLGKYLHLGGHHSLSGGAGAVQVTVNPLSFSEDGLQPSDLIAVDTEMKVEGSIVPIGEASWSAKGMKSSADISLDDLSIKAAGSSISGLTGKVHVSELNPITVSSPQELTARSATAGISLEKPFLRFRVETKNGSPVLYIDRLTVGLVGGAAIIEEALIDTGAKINRVEVQVTRLDLEEVMALSNVEELIATGRVSGKIPLVFGGARLLVEDGSLAADGPGVLKMTSDAARQALGGGGEQAELLLDILENFRYSELSIQITKTESGEDTVKLHAAGSNPDVENNRPVVLNINLTTSLDKIFNAILDGYLLSEKALRATVGDRYNE